MSGIYVASKVTHATTWRRLRDAGYPIISTWIDEAGEGESGDYSELAERCIREAIKAKAVVLYCEPSEILKGALIEVGSALAHGVPVHFAGDGPSISRVFIRHPLWTNHDTLLDAIEAARKQAWKGAR